MPAISVDLTPSSSMYDRIVSHLFETTLNHAGGKTAIKPGAVLRIDDADVARAARAGGARANTNTADVLYTYRGRRELPASIQSFAPDGYQWELHKLEDADAFVLREPADALSPEQFREIELYDWSDPVLVEEIDGVDEQIVLAVAQQNRILDLILGARLSEAQRHKRTKNRHGRQLEIDSVLLGDTATPEPIVVPVEAKMDSERINESQLQSAAAWALDTWPDRRTVPVAVSGIVDGRRLAGIEVLILNLDVEARVITGIQDAVRVILI